MGYENDRAGYWRNCDLWSFSEVQFLLNGEWPDEHEHPPSSLTVRIVQFKDEVIHELGDGTFLVQHIDRFDVVCHAPEDVGLPQMIEDAITAGKLTPIAHYTTPRYKHHLEPRFRPDEVIAWAISRGCFPDFPFNKAALSMPAPNESKQLVALVAPDGAVADTLEAAAPSSGNSPDFSKLATREQLIAAFGSFTGMNMGWFNNLKDTPALSNARKEPGQGGRGHIAEPLFCPYEVMLWLIDPKRRKGRERQLLGAEKAWQLLENYFPLVYAAHSVGDPRQPD